MLNIILFGAPGSGKGTQAEMLERHYGLTHFSTGDMLRSEAASATPLGKSIQNLINEGMFVSDEIIMQLIESSIIRNSNTKGFIFDGVPRTVLQAQMLDKMLLGYKFAISAAILLEADEDELIERILSRSKVSGRADDSNESIIRTRIRLYHEKTEPLANYYRTEGKFFALSGMGKVEDIFCSVCQIIDKSLT